MWCLREIGQSYQIQKHLNLCFIPSSIVAQIRCIDRRCLYCQSYMITIIYLNHLLAKMLNYACLKVSICSCFNQYFKSILFHLISESLLSSQLIDQLGFCLESDHQILTIDCQMEFNVGFADLLSIYTASLFVCFAFEFWSRLDFCHYWFFLDTSNFRNHPYY